ncbi:response regulator [Rhodococcus sp. TAF43]|uniref:response regulator n=1 Tax=Rhodococcus sp. AG1013 TaxID=2183996 RepID=UPI0026741756|nr:MULTISPECIES: response regulator transcription factor [unclassified Rhodococcus (in: high G+C Gram-positive bacteria)]
MRVVLAEDGALLRESLALMLERFGFLVVAAVSDADALESAVAEHAPDMVVTDVRMPPGFTDEGLRAAVGLRRRYPDLAVVVLSQYVELSYADDLLGGEGGRVGYLLKDRVVDVEDFAATLRQIASGATVIDPTVVRQLFRRHRDPLSALSPREREVLALIAEGHSNMAIAKLLFITESAVGKHVGNIFAKLVLPPTDDANRRVLAVLAYLRRDEVD